MSALVVVSSTAGAAAVFSVFSIKILLVISELIKNRVYMLIFSLDLILLEFFLERDNFLVALLLFSINHFLELSHHAGCD